MPTDRVRVRLVDAGEARTEPAPSPPPEAVAEADEDGRLRVARGIIGAVMLSSPVWILIAIVIYRLL